MVKRSNALSFMPAFIHIVKFLLISKGIKNKFPGKNSNPLYATLNPPRMALIL